ncbi:MAG: NifB/NifX family molybdenum-iron cluster-binding protein [Saprospiraceae bacterium]|nr:NifB/NifX family molybdenum-iron cluster-binding protein [Saprospiraceae bacterium]
MKIAVPTTRDNIVDGHFGHCEFYTIFTIDENNKVEKAELLKSPQGCGCKSNIAGVLKQLGVSVMLAGNMGEGALNMLNQYGIQVARGCSGDVNELVNAFLDKKIVDSGTLCSGHGHGHEHGHQCNH